MFSTVLLDLKGPG